MNRKLFVISQKFHKWDNYKRGWYGLYKFINRFRWRIVMVLYQTNDSNGLKLIYISPKEVSCQIWASGWVCLSSYIVYNLIGMNESMWGVITEVGFSLNVRKSGGRKSLFIMIVSSTTNTYKHKATVQTIVCFLVLTGSSAPKSSLHKDCSHDYKYLIVGWVMKAPYYQLAHQKQVWQGLVSDIVLTKQMYEHLNPQTKWNIWFNRVI